MLATELVNKAKELQTEIYTALSTGEPVINIYSPDDVYDLVGFELIGLEQEELRVLILNTKNEVKHIIELYRGNVSCSQVRVAEIFREAIRFNSVAIIVVHNHPSGKKDPSPDDFALTEAILKAGKLLDVQVLDHIIIAKDGYTSLARRTGNFEEIPS